MFSHLELGKELSSVFVELKIFNKNGSYKILSNRKIEGVMKRISFQVNVASLILKLPEQNITYDRTYFVELKKFYEKISKKNRPFLLSEKITCKILKNYHDQCITLPF